MTLPLEFASLRPVVEIEAILSFGVRGIPVPQGSMRAFVRPTIGGPRAMVTHDNPANLRAWRAAIATSASIAMGDRKLLDGPVGIIVTFYLPRPKSHHGTRGNLLPSAPAYPATRPDLEKLTRALKDALTGVVYHDDGQVVTEAVRKVYGEAPGAKVAVTHPADQELAFGWET